MDEFYPAQSAEVHPGDVEKFADELLQPLGLVQGDARIFGPLLRRESRLVVEQVEVAQHRGERGLEVVGQESHQVLPPLLRFPGLGLPPSQGPLDGPQVLLHGPELLGQAHRLSGLVHHLAHRRADLVQPADEPPHRHVKGPPAARCPCDCGRRAGRSPAPPPRHSRTGSGTPTARSGQRGPGAGRPPPSPRGRGPRPARPGCPPPPAGASSA